MLLAGILNRNLHIPIFTVLLLLLAHHTSAQQTFKLKGTVYDSSRVYPLPGVSVLSTSGAGTATNSEGQYEIEVRMTDSIWFSYLNKPTVKYPIARINNYTQFDLSLQINVPVLREVKVMPRNYKLDSIRNRIEYEKVFNFEKPNLGSLTSMGPLGAGININELIRSFQFRKNRQMQKFQDRLIQQEQDKFVEHRFSKALVRRLTQLDGTALDSFMTMYRPPYEFALMASDYDFQLYIKDAFADFKLDRIKRPAWRKEND